MDNIPNVLASRYASERMRALWTQEQKVVLERQLWVAVLKAQRSLGVNVPAGVVEAYESAIYAVDLASIEERERITRHDVKARIEEFNHLARYEHIHRGMTSRDLTENVEQLQIRRSLEVIRDNLVALLNDLADLAEKHMSLVMVARTHNVAAQTITLGKRFADTASELMIAFQRVTELLDRYPLRGIKGPVGTQIDQLDLLGSPEAVSELEKLVAQHCGFSSVLPISTQIYPRSLDLDVISALVQAVSAPSSLAITIRLMAGHELLSEGFQEGQIGSSAMPHKVNARSAERIAALKTTLDGYLTMAASLSGCTWNEGDVSCSAARRVMMPNAFFAADGLIHTARSILDTLEIYNGTLAAELAHHIPLLSTTKLLGALVHEGIGRETAHRIIAEHTHTFIANRRAVHHTTHRTHHSTNSRTVQDNILPRLDTADATDAQHMSLIDLIAADDKVNITHEQLRAIINKTSSSVGRTVAQIAEIVSLAHSITELHPDALSHKPELRL